MNHPFQPLVSQWLGKIALAMEYKRKTFQNDADECMAFFDGPYDFLYGAKHRDSSGFIVTDEDFPRPSFCLTVNKCAEMVQLFAPFLYHRNPHRLVTARKAMLPPPEIFGDLNDPQVQAAYMPIFQQVKQQRTVDVVRASLLESYLNYTPTALDLKTESLRVVDEALIKGMGVWWTEVYQPRGAGHLMIGSFYDTIDNLCIDPDMESLRDAKWVARRCIHPVWEVEEKYGLEPGSIKGNMESLAMQGAMSANKDGDYRRRQGTTNDLLVYWELFSKMGMGTRLSGAGLSSNTNRSMQEELELFGDNCYLVIADHVPYPLNAPPALLESGDMEAVSQRLQWPTPFWGDDGWPFTSLSFHWKPRCVWPVSHLKPGMGELKFINWAYSFIAGKIRTASRDFIAILKSAGEDIKNSILHGTDYELIEIEKSYGTISEVVQFLQHPTFQGDIWRVIQAVEENFEKRVGLTELMYGSTRAQFRSASEANIKADQLRIRPDDMANKMEDAATLMARNEALACRWHLTGAHVAPMLGQVGASLWDQYVVPSDPNDILHQLEYRIEAGSIKKPNRDRDAANMQTAMQTLFQPLFQYSMTTGDVNPLNSLLADWAKSIDLDADAYMLKPVPPPAPPPAPEAGPEGQAMMAPPV